MDEKTLRDQMSKILNKSEAHVDWKEALDDVPAKLRGVRPPGSPHSLWELLEHVRIAQWDILEFSRDPKHVSPDFPSGYWPESPAPSSEAVWNKSAKDFLMQMDEMGKLFAQSKDLLSPIPHGSGQTILREALLAADHNAYHLGQFVLIRRLLGNWNG
ncbi:MAG TPA: DinB family protein [Candidatus Acidoferrales bacterium]|nr:DinB family protein [Candidatus Acidoferrales bacterium]